MGALSAVAVGALVTGFALPAAAVPSDAPALEQTTRRIPSTTVPASTAVPALTHVPVSIGVPASTAVPASTESAEPALPASTAVPALTTVPASPTVPASTTAPTSTGSAEPALTPPAEERVRGLIVKTATTGVSSRSLARASESALDEAATPTDVAIGSPITPRMRVLEFDAPVTLADAEAAARDLQALPEVEWAVPDRLMHAVTTPVIPDDPRFYDQWDVWDASAANGGFSVKAPLLWGRTIGSSDVVVAVIDTGITAHPDLDANVIAGYDFIDDIDVANDGDGRDPNPADPGDWITSAEAAYGYFEGCYVENSSWHGTHVAGTIAAVQGNGIGISGIAPGVRIQPLRALGKCGGYTSDVVAAIRWAAGGSVTGLPPNPTPAKVINLSIGSIGSCSAAEQEVIDFVRTREVTVVVASGNESAPVRTSSPANCNGVIAVAATARNGAQTGYSNYGEAPGEITIAAPGGAGSDSGILSTYNTGSQSPGAATYGVLRGTSMATPHVSAAAALAYSLGATTAADVKQRLIDAAQPFPSGVANSCTIVLCGAGILDVSTIRSTPVGAPDAPKGVTAVAGDRSAVLSWVAPAETGGAAITSYVATAQPGGQTCTTATTSCSIGGLTNGVAYSVTVIATNEAGFSSSASSAVSVTPRAAIALPGAVTDVSVTWRKVGRAYTAVLRWTAPAGITDPSYRARLARVGGSYGSWMELSRAQVSATDLRVGRTYRVQIQAGNEAGWGASKVVRLSA